MKKKILKALLILTITLAILVIFFAAILAKSYHDVCREAGHDKNMQVNLESFQLQDENSYFCFVYKCKYPDGYGSTIIWCLYPFGEIHFDPNIIIEKLNPTELGNGK